MDITDITPEEIGIVDRDTTTADSQRWTDLANSDELENPTEWEAMIGTAILDPARREEFDRKSSVKIAVEHKIFCDCGSVLDQETAACLILKPDTVKAVNCPACMQKALKPAIKSSIERYGEEHARQTITTDFELWSWSAVVAGEDLWNYAPAPRAPRKTRKPKTGRLTPAEIRAKCQGWTVGAEIVISGTYCMRTIPERAKVLARQKPTQQHASPETLARLVRQFEQWCGQGYGSSLAGTPDPRREGHTIDCTAFRDERGAKVCRIDTRLRLTVEHYCGPGQWRADRQRPAAQARYVHANGRILAIVATVQQD